MTGQTGDVACSRALPGLSQSGPYATAANNFCILRWTESQRAAWPRGCRSPAEARYLQQRALVSAQEMHLAWYFLSHSAN